MEVLEELKHMHMEHDDGVVRAEPYMDLLPRKQPWLTDLSSSRSRMVLFGVDQARPSWIDS